MGDANAHPLAHVFEAAAAGRFPDPDGGIDVFPELPGPADGLFGFTAHFAVAAPIPREEVLARVPPGNFSFPMSAPFVTWIAERIGARPGVLDAVLCARGRGIGAPPWLVPEPDADHPRVERARRYRHDVTVLRPTPVTACSSSAAACAGAGSWRSRSSPTRATVDSAGA